MKRIDLEIYRDLYPEILNDIWDKIAELLAASGLQPEPAEFAALKMVEWIRVNWGGQIQVARRLTDPRPQKPSEQDSGPALIDVPSAPVSLVSDRYRQFYDQVGAILADCQIADRTAVALEITRLMQRDYRGAYITKVPKLDQLQRDRGIWLKFRGAGNMDELVRETGLSVMRIYQIRAEVQRCRDKREQPLLPLWR